MGRGMDYLRGEKKIKKNQYNHVKEEGWEEGWTKKR